MEIDFVQYLGANERHIGSTVYDGQDARVLTLKRTFPTTQADLWDAITNPNRIPKWFMPIEGDLHLGGKYALIGNASGTVQKCDEPVAFGLTWEFNGQISWVEVELAPNGDGTMITMRHISPVEDGGFWLEHGAGAGGIGWDMGFLGLDRYIGANLEANAEEAMAWMVSPNGKAFSKESGERWRDAQIEAGDDPAVAFAAAAKTIALYTGEA